MRGRGVLVWVLVDFLLSGCDSPPGRLLIASPYSGGAIRIVVFGASVSIGFCGLMLFCCFSVGLKTFDCSFAFDLSELIAPLGLHARRTRLFSHALLNIQKRAGHRRFPCSRITQPVCSRLISRSHPVRDIGSQRTRSLCKPAGCSVRFGFI